ncbi:MAG: Tfp pilus assembly protein FimT/FimU [Candidatus Aminicenantaceae bacterium]
MKKGFSLIEVTVSLSILAVLVYMASSSFLALAPKYRLQKCVWEINSRLNFAKHKAIFEGVNVRIKFNSTGYQIEIYDQDEKKWNLEEKHFLEGVKIEANNSPAFYPQGTVSNLASIYISNSWGKYKITIAITGRIKIVRL